MRFTVDKLLFATAMVALFLGLRSGYVLSHDIRDWTTDATRIGWANMIIAAVVSFYTATLHGWDARPYPLLLRTALAGAVAAGICTVIWELESSWHALRSRGETELYVNFGLFVLRHAIGGAVLGAVVGFVWGVATQDTKT